MKTFNSLATATLLPLALFSGVNASGDDTPNPSVNASPERMAQWNEWKFGLFIHWGPFSQAAPSNGRVGALLSKDPAQTKRGLQWYKTFDPVKYDPRRWARMAKAAGMRYAVLTAKHHDGFCNWDSNVTLQTVTNPECPWSKSANPDNVRTFLDAFRAEGLKVGLYFSHLNWAVADGAPVKRHPNHDPDFIKKHPDRWKNYVRIAEEQVRELMTNYGPIDIIWFDIHYPEEAVRDAIPMLRMIRRLQPDIIIDGRGTSEYGDFLVQEQFVPHVPPTNYKSWELNIPISKGGGFWYMGPAATYRTAEELILLLADVLHKGGNFLLNVGPDGQGVIPGGEKEALAALGRWIQDNGEAVHGTHASPFGAAPAWGRIAVKGQRLYLFVYDWQPGAKLPLALDREKIARANVLKDGTPVSFASTDDGVQIEIPAIRPPSEHVSVIAVDFKGTLDVTPQWPEPIREKVHHFDLGTND